MQVPAYGHMTAGAKSAMKRQESRRNLRAAFCTREGGQALSATSTLPLDSPSEDDRSYRSGAGSERNLAGACGIVRA
jgi:hypothetical protein